MKSFSTVKVILTLLFLTTLSYKLSAQSYGGSSDSVKKVIIVVRPGYNDQSPDSSGNFKSNNSSINNKHNITDSNNQSTSGSGLATTSTDAPIAPTISERAGKPDYMNPLIKKHKPIHVSVVPQNTVTITATAASSVTQTKNTTFIPTNIQTKHDTVFITKTDTIFTPAPKHTGNKILFLELGGPGLAISLNYDRRFSGGKEGWGYRIGTGYFGDGGNTVFTIPLQINYLLGSNGKYFEFGGGTTFINTTGDNTGNTFIFDRITGFIGTATIGVRYEPAKSLNFRVGFVPIFANYIIYAGGFSVGYTF